MTAEAIHRFLPISAELKLAKTNKLLLIFKLESE